MAIKYIQSRSTEAVSTTKSSYPGNKMVSHCIVSNINSHSVKISTWLVNDIKKCPLQCFSVKNTFDFVEKTKNILIEEDEIMISIDVEALFPSIPIPEAITALQKHLEKFEIDGNKIHTYLKTAKVCMSHGP